MSISHNKHSCFYKCSRVLLFHGHNRSCHDISAEGGLRSDKAVPHYVHLTYSAVQGFRSRGLQYLLQTEGLIFV